MLIYKVINKINGKIYVGQTTKTLKNRWSGHIKASRNNSHLLLHKAIRKYGEDSFFIEELATANSMQELNALEKDYIRKFDSLNKGYNLTEGGDGMHGYSHSEETRKKIGLSNKGKTLSKTAKLNMSKAKTNQWKNKSYRKKQIQSAKERWKNEDQRIKQSIKRGGKKFKVYYDNKLIWVGTVQRQCARDLNLDCVAIGRCLNGKQKSHLGYTFIFA